MKIGWRWCQQCAHLWNFPDQNLPPVLAFFPLPTMCRVRGNGLDGGCRQTRGRMWPPSAVFEVFSANVAVKLLRVSYLQGESINHAKDTLRNLKSTKVQIPNDSPRKNKYKLILILTISTCPSTSTRDSLPCLRKTIIQIKFLAISSSLILLRNKIHPSRHSLRVYRNGSAQV